jgi:hypothetical protein
MTASVLKLDSVRGIWSVVAPIPEPRYDFAACVVGVGDTVREFMSYDPVSEVWSNLASLTHKCYHGAFFVLGGFLYAAGGEDSESKVQRYDVTTNTWTEFADMLEGRSHIGAVTIGSMIISLIVRL